MKGNTGGRKATGTYSNRHATANHFFQAGTCQYSMHGEQQAQNMEWCKEAGIKKEKVRDGVSGLGVGGLQSCSFVLV